MFPAPLNDPTNGDRWQAIDAANAHQTGQPTAVDKTPANDADVQDPTVGGSTPTDRTTATKRVGILGRLAKGAMIAGVIIATAVGAFFAKTIIENQPPKPIAPIEAPVIVNPGELPDANAPPANGQPARNTPDGPVRSPTLPGSETSGDTIQLRPFEVRIPNAGQFNPDGR